MKRLRRNLNFVGSLALILPLLITACSVSDGNPPEIPETAEAAQTILPDMEETAMPKEDLSKYFEGISLTESHKNAGMNNPLMTQRFGADPYVISYGGRVYVYTTGDVAEYNSDGSVKDNSYSKIQTLNVISSQDLINWTDHGWIQVNGSFGITGWGGNSWAPAVAYKQIDGKDKFFIYFANNGNGIGVLTADSPTGPFSDPLGHALIDRKTPNCANVKWLFDPAVLVDDDGRAYIYFGGGVPDGMAANPGTGRAAELGADMISLACEPIVLDAPYLFEDSGINKIGGTYYYSYCTNFSVDKAGRTTFGINNGEIAYMTSESPLGPFEFKSSIYKNPGHYFGTSGNNHHCIFEHNGRYYIAYHAFLLQDRTGITGGYRSANIDYVTVNDDGTIQPSDYTEKGTEPIGNLNPFAWVEASTIGRMAGIAVKYTGSRALFGEGDIVVSDIDTGDRITVYGADFKDGAKSFTARIIPPKNTAGIIQIRAGTDNNDEPVGYLKIEADKNGDFVELRTELDKEIKGVNDITFVFYVEPEAESSDNFGGGLEFNSWRFE